MIIKIKVEHYLNKKLKPSLVKGVVEYPVYVRVSYGRRNERIRSEWLIHTCSEYDFENDKDIQDLKEYETNIIIDILQSVKVGETFNLRARLGVSTDCISERFIGWVVDKKPIINLMIDYISKKAGISKSILSPYVKLELSSEDWKELTSKDIFPHKIKNELIYYSILLEFKEKYYPNFHDGFGYKAGITLTYYEWKHSDAKQRFIDYVSAQNLLDKNQILTITQNFDEMLAQANSWDWSRY